MQQKLAKFIKRKEWRKNPKLFLEDMLGVTCPSHQIEIINAIRDYDKVTIRSANGIGKSYVLSAIILWFFFCFINPDPKKNVIVLFTAPSFDQVKDNIYSNVKEFIQIANDRISQEIGEKISIIGEVSKNQNSAEIRFKNKNYIKGITANKGENQTAGKHGSYVLVVYDEAQGIEDKAYSDYEGITKSGAIIKEIMIGNTTIPYGKCGKYFESFGKNSIHHQMKISAFDTQAFIEADIKLEDYFREEDSKLYWKNKVDSYCLRNYKNVDFDVLEDIYFKNKDDFFHNINKIFPYKNAVKNNNEKLWELSVKAILPFCLNIVNPIEVYKQLHKSGFNPDEYEFKTRVLAEFPDEAGASLFPAKAVANSFENYDNLDMFEAGLTTMGVDVAGGYGKDKSSICVVSGNKEIFREEYDINGVELVNQIETIYKQYHPANIRIERDAIGSPILDFVKDRGLPAIGVHMGGAPGLEDIYDPDDIEKNIALKEKFGCKRDEVHWHFRELLSPHDPNVKPFLLKPDAEIKRVLSAYLYKSNPKSQKIQVITKEDSYKILKRSPDNLDSILLATAEVSSDEMLLNSEFVFITGH